MTSKVLNRPEQCFSDGVYRVYRSNGEPAKSCVAHLDNFLAGLGAGQSALVTKLAIPVISLDRDRCEFIFAEAR